MSSAGVAIDSLTEDAVFSPIQFERSRSLHYVEDSILIYLAVRGSPVTAIRVLDSDSIASVKLRIQSCKGFVVKNQKLVFDGRELARNDCLVRDYGVTEGNVLHLVIRVSDLRFITVNTACGKRFEFQVEKSRNVAFIKEQIAKKYKYIFDIEAQKLICNGEELDNQLMINDICKNNDAVIHLLICKAAKVRAKPIENDLELSVDAPCLKEQETNYLKSVARKPPNRHVFVKPVIINTIVKLSSVLDNLINSTYAGLEKGRMPVMSSNGSGGVYFMHGAAHKYVSVFKPIDEEPMAENNPRGLPLSIGGEGLKRGTRVGEGALREVAAYLLDHPASGPRNFFSNEVGFSGVPPTIMVQCLYGSNGNRDPKMGSLQMFMENHGSCEDIGPQAFPVEEVHKIAVLDLRLANADRHSGNILFYREDKEARTVLIPIDHGYCLPENFEDCTFDWLFWPQARQPFDPRTLNYIKSLDAEKDLALLKFYGWEPSLECSRTLRISTMLLQKGAERGLTPYAIGSILCRETIKIESKMEEMIQEVKDAVLPGSSETEFMETFSELMDHYLDNLIK